MKSFFKSRVLFLVTGFSGMLVIVTYFHNKYLDWSPTGLRILLFLIDLIQLPAFIIGALIRGNPDAPNVAIYYVSLFITYIVIFGGLIFLFQFVRKLVQTRKDSRDG